MPLETLLFLIWKYIFKKKKVPLLCFFHKWSLFIHHLQKNGHLMGFCGFPIRNSSETIICCNLKISTCLRLHRFFNVKLRGPPQRFRSPPFANRRSSVSTSLAAKWGSWESLALETVFKGITGDVEMIGQQPSCYMQNCYNHHPHHQSTPWKANIKMQKQLFEDAFPITNGGFSSHRHGFIPPKLPPHHRPRYGVATIEAPTIPLVARHSARDEDHYLENPQGTMTCHDRRRNPWVILLG